MTTHATQDAVTALCAPTRAVLVPGQIATDVMLIDCPRCCLMLLRHSLHVASVVGATLAGMEGAGDFLGKLDIQ